MQNASEGLFVFKAVAEEYLIISGNLN